MMDLKMTSSVWHGFQRYDFEFEGHNAFIVMPDTPAGDGRWNWCLDVIIFGGVKKVRCKKCNGLK